MSASKPERKRLELPSRYWRLKAFRLVATDLNDWLLTFAVVNVLWFLLSVTVVLLPPATAALYATAYRAYHGTAPDVRAFLRDVRAWLVPAWAWGAGNALYFGALAALMVASRRSEGGNEAVLAVVAALSALGVIGQFYFWPYVFMLEKPNLLHALRNSLFTLLADPMHLAVNFGVSAILMIPSVIIVGPFLLLTPIVVSMLAVDSLAIWLHRQGLVEGDLREV